VLRTSTIVLCLLLAAPVASAQSNTTLDRIKASLHALGGNFRDLDTTAALVMTPPRESGDAEQGRELTLTARLHVKMPDKVKFQVVNTNFPLFNRWVFLQTGGTLSAYDPLSDRRITTDFQRLTGREPVRLDTSLGTLGLLYDPSRYTFRMIGRATRQGAPVHHVRMTLAKAQQVNPMVTIAHTDLYVDANRLVPVYSESFSPSGRRVMSAEFSAFSRNDGLWSPGRIVINDHTVRSGGRTPHGSRPGTMDLRLRLSDGTLFPWQIHATAPDGGTSRWTFSNTKVNSGLPDSLFRL
jgi:outer membrane lipoprotein-sorting protein